MLAFLYPWGLAALLSLGALTFLYFFVFRGRRIEVSSLHLWRIAGTFRLEGRKRKRPPISLPFLLEMMSALLLSLLVAGALFTHEGATEHLVVILDGSASMNAVRARALSKVEELCASSGSKNSITLIESGFDPRVLGREAMEPEEAMTVLARWRPSGPPHAMGSALELAFALAGEEATPLVITDHALTLAGAQVVSVGEPLENTGWISAHWTSDTQLFAMVQQFGKSELRKRIAIFGDGQPIGEQWIDFSLRKAVPLELSVPEGVSSIRLELPEDALPNDNILWMARPRIQGLPTGIEVDDPALAGHVRRAVEASSRLVLSDSFSPALLFLDEKSGKRAGFNVRFHEAEERESQTGPYGINAHHPLTRGIDLDGVIWSADPEFQAGDSQVLLSSGDLALAVFNGDEIVINIDAARSNVFSFPAWPVLVANAAEYAYERSPGLKRFSFRLGESFSFFKPHSWNSDVEVVRPDGGKVAFDRDHIYYGRLEREGLYRIMCNGEEKASIDVNLFAEEESDLTTAARLDAGASVDLATREAKSGHLLNREIALAVLAMLIGCWWILERRSP